MKKFRFSKLSSAFVALLGVGLMASNAFANDSKISYLDSITNSYLYGDSYNSSPLLNLNSDEAKGFEASFNLDNNVIISNSNAKINLSLRDSDLKQTLRMLADKAKLNIVFDKSVEGKITLDFKDIKLNDAFVAIFKSCQLTYVKDGNTITVMKLESAKDFAYVRKNMTVLPIKYVSSESVATFLNDNLYKSNIFGLSTKPIVTSNPRTNQIIVFGNDGDVQAIKRILPILDTKPLINSFKVSHTTPKEMANLICDSLFYDVKTVTGLSKDESGDGDDKKVVVGGGVVACRDTSENSASESEDEGISTFKANPLTITYFPDQGTIGTYGGSVEQIEVVKDFIKTHDKKQLMAYVELSVIELNESGSKDFSNTWDLWTPFISIGFSPSSGLHTESSSPFFLMGNKYPVTTKKSTGDTFEDIEYVHKSNNKALVYQLQYLIENGNGRVLTNPKIMVTNGKEAIIDLTSDYVKTVTSQVLQSSSSITSAVQRTYEIGNDNGMMIKITPFISPDGYVSMNIVPEFATIKEQITTASETGSGTDIQATLLQRRDLELKNIRIKDGETLVLAGLIQEKETQTVKKMPVLSDLPFIGVFFRGNTTSKSKEELVVLVTPHIIKDSQDTNSDSSYDL